MPIVNFPDATLVLVGHGSTLNAESSAPTYQHADELRKRRIFGQVLECFWKQEPSIAGVLRGVFTPKVFIVPLFISEGYFTEQIIPRELGMRTNEDVTFDHIQKSGDKILHYCAPVGTHIAMTDVILQRAREVMEKHPFPSLPKPANTTMFIAGHGTGKNENSRKSIEYQVETIRRKNIFSGVHPAFMEESPFIADCYQVATTRNIVVVPFFISDGLHSNEDIPILLGEPERTVQERLKAGQLTWRNPTERHSKRVWYAQSVGTEPLIADVILERVRELAIIRS